jgi:hypothetical protein
MKRITPTMIAKAGKHYCGVCKRKKGERVEAIWRDFGDNYCEEHKPKRTDEHQSEADYELSRRYGI